MQNDYEKQNNTEMGINQTARNKQKTHKNKNTHLEQLKSVLSNKILSYYKVINTCKNDSGNKKK